MKTRKRTSVANGDEPSMPTFDEKFPAIARWVSQEEGWIELGADHHSRSIARALYGGGTAWEGTDRYGSLEEALRAMDAGIAAWREEHRPEREPGERAREKTPPAPPGRSSMKRKWSPGATRSKRDDGVEADATPAVPRAIAEKVRKLADIAEALRSIPMMPR